MVDVPLPEQNEGQENAPKDEASAGPRLTEKHPVDVDAEWRMTVEKRIAQLDREMIVVETVSWNVVLPNVVTFSTSTARRIYFWDCLSTFVRTSFSDFWSKLVLGIIIKYMLIIVFTVSQEANLTQAFYTSMHLSTRRISSGPQQSLAAQWSAKVDKARNEASQAAVNLDKELQLRSDELERSFGDDSPQLNTRLVMICKNAKNG